MKNFSFKKALAAVAAISVVSCAALPFVSLEASAELVDGKDVATINGVTVAQVNESASFQMTIDRQELTLEELQGMNYKVPIYLRMNSGHPGLNAMECGFTVDSRCTYEVINDSEEAMELGGEMVNMAVTHASNTYEGEYITWMAWAADKDNEKATKIVLIMVDVPKTAAAGDEYLIAYRSVGINPKNPTKASPHLFMDKAGTDYVAAGQVSGGDGWIKIAGAPEETTTTPPETTTTAATTTTTAATTTTTAATTTTTAATTTTTAATTTTTAATTTTTAATTTTTGATTTTTGATTTTTGATTTTSSTTATTTTTAKQGDNGTKATNKNNTSTTKSTTAQTTVASSPKTGVADVLPIAGIAAAVAVLGGVAVVSKKKNDD